MRTTILCGALMALATSTAIAEDPLIQALGFALTGSDNAKVQIIDRKNCVFRIGSYDVFHLNNVHVDRLVIEKAGSKLDASAAAIAHALGMDVTVELHGIAPLYEETGSMFKDAGFSLPAGTPDHIVSNERTLNLTTKEPDRVEELSLKVGDAADRKGGISWGCLTPPLLH